jgi:hypothetical protein
VSIEMWIYAALFGVPSLLSVSALLGFFASYRKELRRVSACLTILLAAASACQAGLLLHATGRNETADRLVEGLCVLGFVLAFAGLMSAIVWVKRRGSWFSRTALVATIWLACSWMLVCSSF